MVVGTQCIAALRVVLLQRGFDLWVKVPPAPDGDARGILSRDAGLQELEGHLTLWYGPDGRLAVRHQPLESGGLATDRIVCSNAAVVPGTWVHVGVNFGPPDLGLYLDAEFQAGAGSIDIFGEARPCGGDIANFGIAGNFNPWVVAASSGSSAEGDAGSPESFFDGAADELRISSVRRDFEAEGF